jgi:hypothetical protein
MQSVELAESPGKDGREELRCGHGEAARGLEHCDVATAR